MRFIAAAAAALAGVTAASPSGALRPQAYPGAFADYLCQPQLADAAGDAWAFDMTPVGTANISISVDNKYTFVAAGCGNPSMACLPGWEVDWTFGAAYQVFQGSTGSGNCWDPAARTYSPCTGWCESLGQGAPQWSLLDPVNASAGLAVTYVGARNPAGANDPMQCPYDPIIGTETPRTVVVQYACDASVPAGQIVSETAVENPPCTYTLAVRTAAACPRASSSKTPLPPPSVPAIPATGNAAPDAPYLCQPVLADQAGTSWGFNFQPLYRGGAQDYAFTDANNNTYHMNICGYASTMCAPSQYPVQYNWGAAVLVLPNGPTSETCYLNNGTMVPCTADCEVLGAGAPVWSLLDATNGGTGGVALQYWGLARLPADAFQCPTTPGGTATLQSVNINIACDAAVTGLQITGAQETSPCAYTITAASSAACGAKA